MLTEADRKKIENIRAQMQAGKLSGDEANRLANQIRSGYGYTIDKRGNVTDLLALSAVDARRQEWGLGSNDPNEAQQNFLNLWYNGSGGPNVDVLGRPVGNQQQSVDLEALLSQLGQSGIGGGSSAPEWQGSQWDDLLNQVANELASMNYADWTKGDQYKALAERYGNEGRMSMQNVLGQIASRTGGLASSYATTAAQQQYNQFMSQLEDVKKAKMIEDIARKIGCSDQAIYDEIKRGQVEILDSELRPVKVYSPEMSMSIREQGNKNREKPLKIGNDHAMAAWIIEMIGDKGYSPSAVCALLGTTPETTFSCKITRQTLYRYIDNGYLWPLTNKDLRYKGNRKRPYKKVRSQAKRASAGTSIEKRPEYINNREEPGHWEMDSVEGKKSTKKTAGVMTERVTRHEIAHFMPDQTAASIVDMLDKMESEMGTDRFREVFKSITVDNGHEFADVEGMERSFLHPGEKRTTVYYCHPRYPGERGSNEKQNQMIRWFFPKGTDFRTVTEKQLQEAIDWINNYPRLLLDWHTSNDLFKVFLDSCA